MITVMNLKRFYPIVSSIGGPVFIIYGNKPSGSIEGGEFD
jgi:hypothetical protein